MITHADSDSPSRASARALGGARAAALVLVAAALGCSSTAPPDSTFATGYTAEQVSEPTPPPPTSAAAAGPVGPTRELGWLTDEAAARADAARDSRSLIIDFRADWCAPCIDLETKVFAAERVAAELEGFVRLRVDLTEETETTQALTAKYAVQGLPTILLLDPQGRELDRVRSFIGADEMLERLRTAQSQR